MRSRLILYLFLGLTAVAGLAPQALPAGQDVDPFYLKAQADGEAAFLARSYAQALANFQIAAFGLYARPAELGRVRLFLGLCHGYLNDRTNAQTQLQAAYALLGPSGMAAADLPDQARADLLTLLKQFKLDAPVPQAAATTPATDPPPSKNTIEAKPPALKDAVSAGPPAPAPVRTQAAIAADRAGLEKEIEEFPRRAEAYFRLAAQYEQDGDLKAAAKVFQSLLDKSPTEIRACLEIGRLRYLERSLRDAEKWLERFLALARSVPIDAGTLASGRAYLILSAHLRGDAAKVKAQLRQEPAFDDALLAALDLKPEDKSRLLLILGR